MITFRTHTHRLIVFYPLTLPHRETEWHTASRCVVTEAWWIAQNRKAIYINHKGAKSKRGARTVLHKLPRHHVTIPSSDFPLIGRRWHLKGITGERSGPRGCPAGDAPRIGFPGRRQGSCCKYCWQWRRPTGGSPAGQTRCPQIWQWTGPQGTTNRSGCRDFQGKRRMAAGYSLLQPLNSTHDGHFH